MGKVSTIIAEKRKYGNVVIVENHHLPDNAGRRFTVKAVTYKRFASEAEALEHCRQKHRFEWQPAQNTTKAGE